MGFKTKEYGFSEERVFISEYNVEYRASILVENEERKIFFFQWNTDREPPHSQNYIYIENGEWSFLKIQYSYNPAIGVEKYKLINMKSKYGRPKFEDIEACFLTYRNYFDKMFNRNRICRYEE